ncbi:VOC family protein [Bizionia echini]|uniref:VOC family protein n=1 Tax=Bizionia echini TaxID=649333 RepID=UPI0030DA0182
MTAKNPVVWFEIYVNNIISAQKFYEQVLNLKLMDLTMPENVGSGMEMKAFPMEMDQDGASGALVKMPGFEPGKNSTIIYFRSDDCSIEEARVADAGGTVFQSKQSIGDYGFMVLAQDLEGNMFGIHSQK